MRRLIFLAVLVTLFSNLDLHAWGEQGHRLVGLVAGERLTRVAKKNVDWLLDGRTLADVASWADSLTGEQVQTAPWHYVNIPHEASGYDRDRDCPSQPGVKPGARNDRWRDCIVDRIDYWEERLGNAKLDRADRAIALKFVVHFIGDLHQPLHASGVAAGGNNIKVRVFGQEDCGNDPARPFPCNLHSVWDSRLISRKNLDDQAYVAALRKLIADRKFGAQPATRPVQWANESVALAKEAIVTDGTNIDDAYYRRHIAVIDERLALAGVRLAADLNRILVTPIAAR
jgi:hypothetical protein